MGDMSGTAERPDSDDLVPVDRLILVRSVAGWDITPAASTTPIRVDLDTVIAMARATGGAGSIGDVPADVLEQLHATGSLQRRRPTVAASPTGPTLELDEPSWTPLPADAWIFPAGAVVGQFGAGGVVVESFDGHRTLLDAVDVTLLDQLDRRAGRSAADIIDDVRGAPIGHHLDRDELSGRLRRLAAMGRVRWYPHTPETDGPARGTEDRGEVSESAARPVPADRSAPAASPATPPGPSAAELAAMSPLRRLRHQPFPGRATLKAVYRRARPLGPPGLPEAGPDAIVPATLDETVGPTGSEAEPPARPAAEPAAQPAATVMVEEPGLYLDDPRVGPAVPGRIPVYAPFQTEIGVILSLGMLTAYARQVDGGRLGTHYEIRRPEDAASLLADLETRDGPAIILCSNYVWSVEFNLDLVRQARTINPDVIAIHGGPHTPKYEADCLDFLTSNRDAAHITVRGEGEITLSEVLSALAPTLPQIDPARLEMVEGISFLHPSTGEMVTTPDRDRVQDLDTLPSPYLTGEFDHLGPSGLLQMIFESNRGCPYGCTFCDWGSMTLSRVRKFDLDRVIGEMAWAAERGASNWVLGDANVGIMSRDVTIARAIVDLRDRFGAPESIGVNVAKNTTKHITEIIQTLTEGKIAVHTTLALQSRDEHTLDSVHRQNISTDHYVALAASFRRAGLPIQADFMLGLPGQTVDSFSADLQFAFDHDIPARVWLTQMLPNAPMNDPAYRVEHGIVVNADGLVVGTNSYTEADRELMKRLRHAYTVLERFGTARILMRYLQWDHGVPGSTFLRELVRVSDDDPERYPLANWMLRYFDLFAVAPMGWRSFYDEMRRFAIRDLGVPHTADLDTVLDLQRFLMPDHGRSFPDAIALDRDIPAYLESARRSLWTTGHAATPDGPLASYGPTVFTIYGDPLDRCGGGMRTFAETRNEKRTDSFWMSGHFELDSPLTQRFAEVVAAGGYRGLRQQLERGIALSAVDPDAVPVELTTHARALNLSRSSRSAP